MKSSLALSCRLARFSSLLAAAVALAAVACGPKASTPIIPNLPGDGDTNVTHPPDDNKPPVVDDPWSGRSDMIVAPAPTPPKAVSLPPIDRFTLPNGLSVVVVKNDRLPVVSMQLMVRAGRSEEPLARQGVAELTADLLPTGTKKKNALALAKAIDFVGGSITADAGFEATWVTCTTMTKDTKVCLELLPEMLTQPSFPEDEIKSAKSRELAGVSRRLDDASAMADVQAQNLLWGDDHVRGRVTSAAWINQLTRADVVAWHKTWFVPGNATLAVSGDVDAVRLKKDLTTAFAGWKKAPVPARPKHVEAPFNGVRVRLVDKPGQTQTQIRIAQYGIRHDDSRFFPTLVWNYALGGGAFSSRLMKVVRSEGGKTYGASSAFDRNLDRGSVMVSTFTRTAETLATLELVAGEVARMQATGPTDDEVAAAIANLAGSYAMRVAGADDLAGALVTADLHGLSQQYVSDFPLLVGRVTRAEAAEAAASVLNSKSFVVVLVGDGDALAKQLDQAKVPFERVLFTDPIGPQPAKDEAPVDPRSAAAAIALLDQALAAKGGAKVTSLKSLRMEAKGTLAAQGQTLAVVFKRTLVLPGSMRMDIELDKQFQVALVVTGDKGWQSGPAGIDDLPASMLPQLALQRFVDPELLLTRHKEPGTKVAILPGEKVDGVVHDAVRITSKAGFEVTVLLDPTSHLLRQSRYTSGGATTKESFHDYKEFDGIQVAQRRVSQGGGETSDLTVTAVEINPTVDAKIFDKPAS